ncbi:hypothetical protein ACRBEV_27355 [Methylobacterium phyllosphaerae]
MSRRAGTPITAVANDGAWSGMERSSSGFGIRKASSSIRQSQIGRRRERRLDLILIDFQSQI